ncbi:unnamed protein product [Didymodactylos carnosus]|uniref:Uncharacterized protein n=1 Tax=Didymodactylos carnosus TaxID=1234261 RepID=A0A815NMN6_9BILA|nr:unnamed protein product [Didymodactylos carnosus]CAF1441836.1 unnamed protein product [Didymodactylos carnosus]CAF4019821.1 unnamed protein product [Didymodactylos carnosus]CAF4317671.1 unnamed protein product [Didymodactylos carnosus]
MVLVVLVSLVCYKQQQLVGASRFGDELFQRLKDVGSDPLTKSLSPQTCSNVFELLSYPRKIIGISVRDIMPLRVKVEVQLTNPATSKTDVFSVDGLVCVSSTK